MPNQQKQRSAGTDDLAHLWRAVLSCALEFGVNTGGNRRDRTVCQRQVPKVGQNGGNAWVKVFNEAEFGW